MTLDRHTYVAADAKSLIFKRRRLASFEKPLILRAHP